MGLKLIGAGLGRTGTLSIKLALEQLGLGPCYHMVEVTTVPTLIEQIQLVRENRLFGALHRERK